MLGVRAQIEVGPVGDPLELGPFGAGEAEAILDVDGALGIVTELLLRMLKPAQIVRIDA